MRRNAARTPSTLRHMRLAAMTCLGASLGIGGAVLGVSLVQANDGMDMYAVLRFDEARAKARRAAAPQIIVPASHSSYAPARALPAQPLAGVNQRGMVLFPDFNLNPFRPMDGAARNGKAKPSRTAALPAGIDSHDVVSGASNTPRTICVRLCDGYQHPLALLRSASDLPGHEALCRATFPGVPTRIFSVAAGAEGIDEAVSSDGRTYRSLPMAYAYQTSIDPACARPRTGDGGISPLRDFTLRAGDTVMINGRPLVFDGSTRYPFTSANFRDFRSSGQVSNTTRRKIDDMVGVSRQERLQREVRRMARVREASLSEPNRAIDLVRGGVRIEASAIVERTGAPVRVIELPRR